MDRWAMRSRYGAAKIVYFSKGYGARVKVEIEYEDEVPKDARKCVAEVAEKVRKQIPTYGSGADRESPDGLRDVPLGKLRPLLDQTTPAIAAWQKLLTASDDFESGTVAARLMSMRPGDLVDDALRHEGPPIVVP